MDPLIDAYITDTYPSELASDIYRAFALFDNFDMQDYISDFVDIVVMMSYDSAEGLQDTFIAKLNEKVDFIFTNHLVRVNAETTLHDRVELMGALYDVQTLEDYGAIAITMESDDPCIEKFASVFSDLCALEETDIIAMMEHVDPIMMDRLKVFVMAQPTAVEQLPNVEGNAKLLAGLKSFKAFLNGKECLGLQLVDNGALINQPFKNYLPYIEGLLENKASKQLAIDVLSLLYISCDGHQAPFKVFHEWSHQLFDNNDTITGVDIELVNLVGNYAGYLGAIKNEKSRLP